MGRAAAVLRHARKESGLTQAALARLAGMTQSVVSEYENGRREPSFDAVDRLVSAAGLAIEISPQPRHSDRMLDNVLAHSEELRRALRPLGAQRIRVFGSVARGDDSDSSDIDLVVDVPPATGIFGLLRMQREAEAVLGRSVDLVPNDGLRPAVAAAIEREGVVL
ncbi:helix-turn-helix domain-containing protein [Microbacterium sp. SD291]|uniref:helix-turn-helix domain-containing protein n=1 Tax=Microbacterium sp. SD291 TaxID=2782007 RepID=UPI001A976087|nr:XRE family transcriptional regulator [Microbacterium sp. SD291]MBO0980113.1 XRE family transcriptional regulator [Microbacterium sp. SD291]